MSRFILTRKFVSPFLLIVDICFRAHGFTSIKTLKPLKGIISIESGRTSLLRCRNISSRLGFSRDSSEDNEIEGYEDKDEKLRDKKISEKVNGRNIRDKGKDENFEIVQEYSIPSDGFRNNLIFESLTKKLGNSTENERRMEALALEYNNVTLPVALMLVDPEAYPTVSRARKAIRKKNILLHRGPLESDEDGEGIFLSQNCKRGRVDDRVYPNDVIAKQVRISGAFYPRGTPAFDVPIVYEDDHFAIINKPAGIVVYSHRGGGYGNNTIRSILPFILTPPKEGTLAILRRPQPVHRIDKPTSGLLLVAKTKPAMVHLSRQFVERKIKKSYTAILNGIPDEYAGRKVSAKDAREKIGVDVDMDEKSWQVIDYTLEGKSAVTLWRAQSYVKSLKANEEVLTVVEVKPKTGRFHQIRRHMAWVCERPLIGDTSYDGGGPSALNFRGNGLFLCSNKVKLDHPYYNSPEAEKESQSILRNASNMHGTVHIVEEDSVIQVHAEIDLPKKFTSLIKREEERFNKFNP